MRLGAAHLPGAGEVDEQRRRWEAEARAGGERPGDGFAVGIITGERGDLVADRQPIVRRGRDDAERMQRRALLRHDGGDGGLGRDPRPHRRIAKPAQEVGELIGITARQRGGKLGQ